MGVLIKALPPEEAMAALAARGFKLAPSFNWQELYASDHAAMFTVAKSAGFDVLEALYEAVKQALNEGETLRDFSRKLTPTLIDKGWWGRQEATNPQTGQTVLAQLGSPRRLKTIYEVNMRVSHASGHWQRFERQKASRPFLRYVAIKDDRTRPSHMALHNVCLPVDHPFWNEFAPPNGWNCRCTLQSLRSQDVDQLVKDGEVLQFAPPTITRRAWLNKATGATRLIPDGIDPGWDYNPGKAGHEETVKRLIEKYDPVLFDAPKQPPPDLS